MYFNKVVVYGYGPLFVFWSNGAIFCSCRVPAGLSLYLLSWSTPTRRSLSADLGSRPTASFLGGRQKKTRSHPGLPGTLMKAKWILNRVGGTLSNFGWSVGLFLYPAQSKRSTEAQRGIGIYRWQVWEGKKRKRASTRYMEQSLFYFIFKPASFESQSRFEDRSRWKVGLYVQKGTTPTFLLLNFEEQLQLWRKSTIFFSNCYSSGTAEWAKHVWSFV